MVKVPTGETDTANENGFSSITMILPDGCTDSFIAKSALAEYLAYRSHTLFAFWDGVHENNNCDIKRTGVVSYGAVRYKIKGKPSATSFYHAPLVSLPEGAVVHIDLGKTDTKTFPLHLWTQDKPYPKCVNQSCRPAELNDETNMYDTSTIFDEEVFTRIMVPFSEAVKDHSDYKLTGKEWEEEVARANQEFQDNNTTDSNGTEILMKSYANTRHLAELFKKQRETVFGGL